MNLILPKTVKISKAKTDLSKPQVAYKTTLGSMYRSSVEQFLSSRFADELRGKVQLIFTSPPFPLASPKSYGNSVGDEYVNWLTEVCLDLSTLLKPSGSLVVEIGNSWDKGSPTMSTAPLETLIAIHKRSGLNICQQFVVNNPNRLPTPIVYVNKERIRVKDTYTHVWWYGKSERPYASNAKVLKPYSLAMQKLLERGTYNHGTRPSEHKIGETSFLRDNGGAIPSNVLEFAGSRVNSNYRNWCTQEGISQHPAKMAEGVPDFFIKFLTRKNDIVFDPFGGSNTTGSVAESLGRRWVSVERDNDYIRGSLGRFSKKPEI